MTSSNYQVKFSKKLPDNDFILGIAEKPTAASRIAKTLSSSTSPITITVSRSSQKIGAVEGHYCHIGSESVIIISALGHLFTLEQAGLGWQYPVYDFKWVPNFTLKDQSKFDKRIESTVEAIRMLLSKASRYIIMTDYDEEGEVIGGLIIDQLIGSKMLKQTKRMRFSSFSKQELETAYQQALHGNGDSGINFGMYYRGLMRHYLDWLWGINLSRALMISLKNSSGQFTTLSTGRVQGPTLSFVAKRQYEIDTFVPIPYFSIDLEMEGPHGISYRLEYVNGQLHVRKQAEQLIHQLKDQPAIVKAIEDKKRKIAPPVPFNLSSLQKDAYRYFHMTPSRALAAAEQLYLSAAISYPRTSSEKYPPSMDHLEVLKELRKQGRFETQLKSIQKQKQLDPKQGKKADPAHPCIYPTGIDPGDVSGDAKRLYELVVHRYLATFGKPAIMESNKVSVTVNKEDFFLRGSRTLSPGWRVLYGKFGKTNDVELPEMTIGQTFELHSSKFTEKFSRPSPAFNQSSLLKEMEDNEIGTKATRADIIKSLFDRKFLEGDAIEITKVGSIINEVLEEFSSQVVSVELSRRLEQLGDLIEQSYSEKSGIDLSDAILQGITYLHGMLDELRAHESDVGRLISTQLTQQRKEEREIAPCHECNKGMLKIIHNAATGKRFIGCTQYFVDKSCTATFPIPQRGNLTAISKKCPLDGFPQLRVSRGKRPWTYCLNPECESKKEYDKKRKSSKKEK